MSKGDSTETPLRAYINGFPVEDREQVRKRLCKAGGVKASALRHWENGTRSVPGPSVNAVCKATEGVVQPHQLRPDIFPVPEPAPRRRAAAGAARDTA